MSLSLLINLMHPCMHINFFKKMTLTSEQQCIYCSRVFFIMHCHTNCVSPSKLSKKHKKINRFYDRHIYAGTRKWHIFLKGVFNPVVPHALLHTTKNWNDKTEDSTTGYFQTRVFRAWNYAKPHFVLKNQQGIWRPWTWIIKTASICWPWLNNLTWG